MRAALLAFAMAATAGCAAANSAAIPAAAPSAVEVGSDTLRGTFVLEGSDPAPIPVLHTAAGRVALDDVPPAMQRLVQLDLWVRGTAEGPDRFRVDAFLVRGAGGQPAWDGTLERSGSAFALRLSGGSLHALAGAPEAFAGLVGRRVWVVETPAQSVASYGVIQ